MRLRWVEGTGRGAFDGVDAAGKLRAGVCDLTRPGEPETWHGFTWERQPRDTGHLGSRQEAVAAVEALLDNPDAGVKAAPPPAPKKWRRVPNTPD